MNQGQLGDHLGSISGVFDPFGDIWIWTVKKFGNGWSKSIVLENKVVSNFDFRNGGHLVNPFQSYGQIYFNKFQQKLDGIG